MRIYKEKNFRSISIRKDLFALLQKQAKETGLNLSVPAYIQHMALGRKKID